MTPTDASRSAADSVPAHAVRRARERDRRRPTDRSRSWRSDGYIFVVQNLRGRFGSEGTFELSSKADLENPKATSETTDAYDSIDWLVKNVPNNNGKVGMFGVSYDGLTVGDDAAAPAPGAEGDLASRRRPPISG